MIGEQRTQPSQRLYIARLVTIEYTSSGQKTRAYLGLPRGEFAAPTRLTR